MSTIISSDPPLGQVTCVKTEILKFLVRLEIDKKHVSSTTGSVSSWEVALWSNHVTDSDQGQGWQETILRPVHNASLAPTSLQYQKPDREEKYFSTSLTIKNKINFTIKFRPQPHCPWTWVRDSQDSNDASIILTPPTATSLNLTKLTDVIGDLNSELAIKRLVSQSPRTELWSIETSVGPASGELSACADARLGVPWGGFSRWFALVRASTPWLAPRHGASSLRIEGDAILAAFLSPRGKHMVVLAVSGVEQVMVVLRSSESGHVVLHSRNDGESEATGLFLAAIGDNFESALAATIYHARDQIWKQKEGWSGGLKKELTGTGNDARTEWRQSWVDGLGYCTWNGLGQRLTDEDIVKAVGALAEANINITNLIIDDNWQDIDYTISNQFQRGWSSFEAEPRKFPLGLKETVSRIRSKHPSIQHVAVWHALLGYWGGITPNSKLSQAYKTTVVERGNSTRGNMPLAGPIAVVAKEDIARFYEDFYSFLAYCGVDGVKTDAQFMTDTLVYAKPRRELINEYLDAWSISSLHHFGTNVISCMSQTPHIVFYSQLLQNQPTIVARTSDDFFPNIPESHPWHVWANAHNALLMHHLNILPDWDMFQSQHEYSGFHAAARCLSGGPVYITDVPGQHDLGLIDQLTGLTPRGETVIFRPSVLGRCIDQYVGYDDGVILKIGCYHGSAGTGTAMLGAFNVSSRLLSELVSLDRFPGVLETGMYVVRSHRTGAVSPVLNPKMSATALLLVSLDVSDYDILAAYPVTCFETATRGVIYAANLGLVGKMTGAAAVLRSEFAPTGHRRRVQLTARLKALGVLGLYISRLPQMTVEDDFIVTMQGQVIPLHTVSLCKQHDHVLRVDIEAAWREMTLEAGWGNYVEVLVQFCVEDHLVGR